MNYKLADTLGIAEQYDSETALSQTQIDYSRELRRLQFAEDNRQLITSPILSLPNPSEERI